MTSFSNQSNSSPWSPCLRERKNVLLVLSVLAFTACAQSDASRNENQKEKEKKTLTSSNDRVVGGSCEGCEAALEYGDRKLTWDATLEDYNTDGPKIEVSGTIYQRDSITPAKDIILYFYHTDQTGVYPIRGDETGWGERHGYLRGWIKTNENGQYKFNTLRPASYPDTKNPQHIHAMIKEPGLTPYWIDEFVFDDDPNLTADEKRFFFERGGDGVLKDGVEENGVMKYKRDIVLGLNIPGY